jgi:hypothetical protein
MTCITSITIGTVGMRSLRSFAVNTLICQICEARASTPGPHEDFSASQDAKKPSALARRVLLGYQAIGS